MPSKYDNSGLSAYFSKIADQFRTARVQYFEDKWNTNRRDFLGEFHQRKGEAALEDWRSRTTAHIVSQKVRALYSIILDVYLQGGRIPFKFLPHDADAYGKQPTGSPDSPADLDIATKRVEQAFERCHAERAFMDNAFMACMMGKTFAKITRRSFRRATVTPTMNLDFAAAMGIDPAAVPRIVGMVDEEGDAWEYVSNWEIDTDPEAAFNCRTGSMVWQTQLQSPYMLRSKMGQPYFIDGQIEEAINGATKASQNATQSGMSDQSLPPYLRSLATRQRNIVYREGWGRIPNKHVNDFLKNVARAQFQLEPDSMNARRDTSNAMGEDGKESYVHVCMANDVVVRFALVDESDNPFYETDLERIPDEQSGRGVADNAKMGHDMASTGLRMFEDNKRWSGNVQMAMKRRLFTKTPDSIKPGGMWWLSEDARSADEAMKQIIIQDVGESLLSWIQIGEKYADWDTLMSKIEQGQQLLSDRTATEIAQQARRADSYTGTVMRNFDEGLTEPIANRFYLNMVADPDLKGGKGDFVCQALGFQSYQDNVATINSLMAMYNAFRVDQEARGEFNIRKLMETLSKRNRIDPSTFLLTDAEKQARSARMAQQQALQQAQAGLQPQLVR